MKTEVTYNTEESVRFDFVPLNNGEPLGMGEYDDGELLNGSKSNLTVQITVFNLETGEIAVTSTGAECSELVMLKRNDTTASVTLIDGFAPTVTTNYRVVYVYTSDSLIVKDIKEFKVVVTEPSV